MRRTIATLATLLLAMAVAACGGVAGNDTAPSPASDAPPLPDSIRELVEEVAELRGLEAPESLVALTVARADLPDTYLTLVTEEDRAESDTLTEIYRLLGYLDDDEHLWDIQTSFFELVLGFYSTDHKTLWVVTEGAGVGLEELTPSQRKTLVHEIIHALQDYHFDLNATFDSLVGNLDAELAFTSVVEGDAVTHTNRHAIRSLALPGAGGVFFLAAGNQLSRIPAPVLRAIYFPYRTGASWAAFVLVNEGAEALNALFVEPPPATTLILHKELLAAGWEPEELGESSLPARQIQESLGSGLAHPGGGFPGRIPPHQLPDGTRSVRAGLAVRVHEPARGGGGEGVGGGPLHAV